MNDFDLMHRVPRSTVTIVDTSNPVPPIPKGEPGLLQKLSFPPSAIARAIFEADPYLLRKIPWEADEVLIRPGRNFGISNTFELPAIGEGSIVVHNRKVEVINMTPVRIGLYGTTAAQWRLSF